MDTLTHRCYKEKYMKHLEYRLQDESVPWAVECDAPHHSDKVGLLHRTPFQGDGGNVITSAQSLANDTYLHFNNPKLVPCLGPDLYPGSVGGYTIGTELGVPPTTVVVILHLMADGVVTTGGAFSK